MSKPLASYFLGAALLKPVTVFRDVVILWALGVGAAADVYFAAISVVLLGQSLSMGPLANAWIPPFLRMNPEQQNRFVIASTRQEFVAAALYTVALFFGVSVFLGFLADGHPLLPYLSTLRLLVPVGGMAYILGWLGNFLLARGRIRAAQIVWAVPSVVLVPLGLALNLWPPEQRGFACVAVTYIAYGVGLATGYLFVFGPSPFRLFGTLSVTDQPSVWAVKLRVVSSIEVGAFAAMNYGLMLLPSMLGAGATSLLALSVRLYSSLSVIVVTPISQAILMQSSLSTKQATGGPMKIGFYLIAGSAMAVPLIAYIGLYLASKAGIVIKPMWDSFPSLAMVWLPIFVGMSVIQVLARQLATMHIVVPVSVVLAAGYVVAAGSLWVPVFPLTEEVWIKALPVYCSLGVLCVILSALYQSQKSRSSF
jgi:hypothetical protein